MHHNPLLANIIHALLNYIIAWLNTKAWRTTSQEGVQIVKRVYKEGVALSMVELKLILSYLKSQEKERGVRTRFPVEEDLHLLLGALLEGRGKSTQRLAARLLAMHEWAAGWPLQDVQSSVTA